MKRKRWRKLLDTIAESLAQGIEDLELDLEDQEEDRNGYDPFRFCPSPKRGPHIARWLWRAGLWRR